jgi:predicted peptidase
MLVLAPMPLGAQRVEAGFNVRSVTVNGTQYRYQVFIPADYTTSTRLWPVILFLHGALEGGTDGRQTTVGLGPALRNSPDRYPAIVIMPQAPLRTAWNGVSADAALAALDQVLAGYRADPDRVYLTGVSMGGNGVWKLAYRFPQRFAALAPIAGYISLKSQRHASRAVAQADSVATFAVLGRRLKDLPTWIFHGEADGVIPVREARRAADALKAADGNVRYTEYPGAGHVMWDTVYASPQFQEWLFAQHRSR